VGFIQVESPQADGMRSLSATLRVGTYWVRLCEVYPEELVLGRYLYSFSMGRWDFSDGVNVSNVTVRFMLPDGLIYEISAIAEGGDYAPRVPARVLMLSAATVKEVGDCEV